jgi:hypothetical protein
LRLRSGSSFTLVDEVGLSLSEVPVLPASAVGLNEVPALP